MFKGAGRKRFVKPESFIFLTLASFLLAIDGMVFSENFVNEFSFFNLCLAKKIYRETSK